jgi:hypothetical protein
MSLANGTITHWLYEAASGSLRERMRVVAEVLLLPVAPGDVLEEPFPDLFPAQTWVPPANPRKRAPRRRTR